MTRGRPPQPPATPVTYDQALTAIKAGDIDAVRTMVRSDPAVLHLRAETTPPLGYFSGATLLHHVAGNPGCITYIMVERWQSVGDFRAYVPKASTADQDEFEAAPRQRVVLGVV